MANIPLLGEKKWTDNFSTSSIKVEPIKGIKYFKEISFRNLYLMKINFCEKIDLFEEPKTKSKFARKKSACHIILEQTVEDFCLNREKKVGIM